MNEQETGIRQLPHDIGFEKSVLSLIMSKAYLMDEAPGLTEDHFYLPQTKVLFQTIVGMRNQFPDEYDLTMVVEKMHSEGRLDAAGGASSVYDIYTYATGGSESRFRSYVEGLNRYLGRRMAIKAGQELIETAYAEADPEATLRAAGPPITAIHDTMAGVTPSPTSKELLEAFVEDFQKLIEGKKTPMGIPTGFESWDRGMRGIHPSQVVVISGKPATGKTVLGDQILLYASLEHKIPTLLLSIELPPKTVISRRMVYASGLSAKAVLDPKSYARQEGMESLSKLDLAKIKRGVMAMREAPMFMEFPNAPSIQKLIAMIRKHHRKNGVKIVCVDYAQLIKTGGKHFSKEQEISEISHTFQAIAKELDITIILLSQENKEGRTKHGEVIAEDADLVLSIIARPPEDDETEVKHICLGIRKDRHNGLTGGTLPIVLLKERLQFVEDIPEPQYATR